MSILSQDVRYALRVLAKARGFSAIAILMLALGIGANTALFSVVNGVLLNPLPYPHPEQLAALYGRAAGYDHVPIAYPNFLDWQRDSHSFSSIALYHNEDYNYTGAGLAERLSGYMISADFFSTLGVNPILGRTFRPEDDQLSAAPVVILGGGLWRRRFASSPDIIGKSIVLNDTSYTIIGVIPPSFTFYGADRDVYMPIGQWSDPMFRDRRIVFSSGMIGRLKPGVTVSEALADLATIAHNLEVAYPDADKGVGALVVSMKQDMVGNVRPFLLVLMGAVGFVLLIACVNVANLLLARATGRSREFAIRSAMGASNGRIVGQLLTESTLVAGMGGALGLLIAYWGTKAVLGSLPGSVPRAGEIALDAHVLFFTLFLSLFAGIAFGLAPALKAARENPQEVLKESARGSSGARHRLQGAFVVGEVAMALILLVGAGLMIRSLAALWHVDPGFYPNHAITFSLSLPASPRTTTAETRARLREFDDKMMAIPGVEAVSATLGSRPMQHDSSEFFWIEGQPKPAELNDMHQSLFTLAGPGFQKAMGITLERGRFITPQDDEHSPIAIVVDDVFAHEFFGSENPIGKHINLATFGVQAEIVGIVRHVKQWGLGADPKSALEAEFFYPFMQLPDKIMRLAATGVVVVLRTKGDPGQAMGPVRSAVERLDPRDVIYNVSTMDAVVARSFAAQRFSMILLSIFAALALVLSCVGIYGVISHLVSQRTHEIGVRAALGAQRKDVLRLILGHGARMALAGVGIGFIGALALTRMMSRMLFGVSATDPLTFASVAGLLVIVALAACYLPARRAMKVDPIEALRYE